METAPVDYIIANEYDEQANEIYLLCGTHGYVACTAFGSCAFHMCMVFLIVGGR
jgi:hypothetical protein